MPINNEIPCPVCGKLIALFEKPTNPRRLIGSCNCAGHLREVIELDNPDYLSEQDILEPAEPGIEQSANLEILEPSLSVTPPADKRRRKTK